MLAGIAGVLLLVGIGWFSWYATQTERFPVSMDVFRQALSGFQHHDAASQDERATTPVAIAPEAPSTDMVEPVQREVWESQPSEPAGQDKKTATPVATAQEVRVTVGRLRQRVRHDIGSNVRGGGEQIRLLQERLHAAGYTPGPIDGIFGPRTRHAIRRFQQAHGLQATGRLNATTRQALGF
jgi:murein L,D-transpeptidase YcbB/YkuD